MMTSTNLFAFFDQPTQQNLESNQRGRLTAEQQAALKRGVRQQWWRVGLWVIVLAVLCSAFGLFAWALLSNNLESSLLGPVLGMSFVISVGLLVLGAFLFPDLSLIFANGDIEDGQVESASGKIEWTGRRYQVVSDTRSLRTVRGNVSLPPPGAYRFYCLPNSGLVIQAEALSDASVSQNQGELIFAALSRANRFTNDDLQINRQGSLSGSQVLRLISFAIGQGLLFLFAAGFGIWMYFNIPTSGEDQIWIVVLGFFMGILALVAVWNILKTLLDLVTRSVTHEEGFVIRQEHRTRNGRYYTYQIKKLKFRVSRNAFHALVDGWMYRIYYSSRSKRLLAIEPLGTSQAMVSNAAER